MACLRLFATQQADSLSAKNAGKERAEAGFRSTPLRQVNGIDSALCTVLEEIE